MKAQVMFPLKYQDQKSAIMQGGGAEAKAPTSPQKVFFRMKNFGEVSCLAIWPLP
jgi:hypothetical protein